MAVDWWVSACGMVVVAVRLRDIFHTLWHPSGFGTTARAVIGASWLTHQGSEQPAMQEMTRWR